MPVITGHCLCNKVKIEWRHDGAEVRQDACYCEDCRRFTGGPYAIALGAKHEDVTFDGEYATFGGTSKIGNAVTRRFCAQCGSCLSFETTGGPDVGLIWLMPGVLDGDLKMPITTSQFVEQRWESIPAFRGGL